eukprot:gene104-biopygen170
MAEYLHTRTPTGNGSAKGQTGDPHGDESVETGQDAIRRPPDEWRCAFGCSWAYFGLQHPKVALPADHDDRNTAATSWVVVAVVGGWVDGALQEGDERVERVLVHVLNDAEPNDQEEEHRPRDP